MLTDALTILPSAAASAILWFVAVTTLLYFARDPAHRAIVSMGRMLHNAMRVGASAVARAEGRLRSRNTEVLLATGRENAERLIEREFERIEAAVHRDLAQSPELHRRLREQLNDLDKDLRESSLLPPEPPGWTEAVEAVAAIETKSDAMVVKILENIHRAMVDANNIAAKQFRTASSRRNGRLSRMMPRWRKLGRLLSAVDTNVTSVIDRSKTIDRLVDEYREIVKRTDTAVRTLSASSLVQFFTSGLVLAIAIGGALINFNLIARPLSEMVGGSSAIGAFRMADVAALVIILVEASMGLFLMESLRVTRLFPVINTLSDKLRIRMAWVTVGILFGLATVEAGLAYMREILLQDELATNALLRGEAAAADFESTFLWITTGSQMGLGFILPFALVFIAIPLGTFIYSTRTVLGLLLIGLMRSIALAMRIAGNVCRYGSLLFVDLYDVLIFGPLWAEARIKGQRDGHTAFKWPALKGAS